MSGEGGLRLLPGQRAQVLALINARTMPLEERIRRFTDIVTSSCEQTRQDTITSIASQLCFNKHPHVWSQINQRCHDPSRGCVSCATHIERASGVGT